MVVLLLDAEVTEAKRGIVDRGQQAKVGPAFAKMAANACIRRPRGGCRGGPRSWVHLWVWSRNCGKHKLYQWRRADTSSTKLVWLTCRPLKIHGMTSMRRTRGGLPKHCSWNVDRHGTGRVRSRRVGFSPFLTAGPPWSPAFMEA